MTEVPLDSFSEFAIEAISYLSTYIQFGESEDESSLEYYEKKQDQLVNDCVFLYESAKADREVHQVLVKIRNSYNSILNQCIQFCEKVKSLFSSLPSNIQKNDLECDNAHASLNAVVYLQYFAQYDAKAVPDSVQFKKIVDIMQQNLSKIANFASTSPSIKRQYVRLQLDFDEILEKTSDFTKAMEDFRDNFPSLV